MRVIDDKGNEIANPDLDNGYVFETDVIRQDAEPLSTPEQIDDPDYPRENLKFVWAEDDFEKVLRYVQIPKAERIEKEIDSLKAKLRDTDYISSKLCDALMGCDGLSGILSAISSARKEYASVVDEREKWRERICELESMLAEDRGEEDA